MTTPVFRKTAKVFLSIAALSAVSGCVGLGGNIKGSFACKAPDGTCAPSTAIDDGALAAIGKDAGGDLMPLAAPNPPAPNGVRAIAVADAEAAPIGAGGKVLRIVFPAYVDRFGRLHDKTSVQTVVSSASAAISGDALASSAQSPGLLGAAESAPQMFADLSGEAPAVAGVSAPQSVASATGSAATSAADAASAVDDIKAQVAKKIEAARAVRTAASFPGKEE
jgi:conjugal transfer pilus assembly protein TraV